MDYKNNKVVVLSGYARGGTNIVWNILQSHPDICSPIYETGEIFNKSFFLKVCKFLSTIGTPYLCKKGVDSKLFEYKLKNMKHADNKYRTENKIYSSEEIEKTVLCTKAVNKDIDITELLLEIYPDLYFIALSRNGYALAESYIRRGYTAKKTGVIYSNIAEQMKKYSSLISNFEMIKFEDCLRSPFSMADKLFSFLSVEKDKVDKLRLKSKKVVKANDQHSIRYGEENKKYWFDKDDISQILDPSINEKQIQRLSNEQIKNFNREAEHALEFFGYQIL